MRVVYEIRRYLTATGRDRFGEWLDGLRDLNGRKAVLMRLQRVQAGNLGDHKHLRDGVWEFRLTVGPGYRVYFGRDGQRLILLLAGGDKRTQKRDIEEAVTLFAAYRREQDADDKP